MDALPAVNRPPLCTPSPILGSGSLSPLPVNRFPASGKGVPPPLRKAGAWFESRRKHRCFPLWQRRPTQPAADARVETRRPAAAHRHTVLTVTTHTRLGRHKGQRGSFGSRGAPNYTRSHPRPETAAPNDTRSRPPPWPTRRHPPQPSRNPHPPRHPVRIDVRWKPTGPDPAPAPAWNAPPTRRPPPAGPWAIGLQPR